MIFHPKVLGSAGGGSIGTWLSIVLLWVLSEYAHVTPPETVIVAITGLITVLVGFAGGYLTHGLPGDVPLVLAKPVVPPVVLPPAA